MKTNEEIIERYLSEDSADFFNAQRTALLCMLPYEMAKPYLHPEYVSQTEAGTLPEDEAWEVMEPEKLLIEFIPELYKGIAADNSTWVMEGLLYAKSFVWVYSDELYEKLAPLFEVDFIDCGKEMADTIAKHFNYTPTVEDAEFEEIPTGESNSAPEGESK